MQDELGIVTDAISAELQPAVTLVVTGIVGKFGNPVPLSLAEETIDNLQPLVAHLHPQAADPAAYAKVKAHVLQQIKVTIADPLLLAPKFEPWFNQAVSDGALNIERWYSYKQFLAVDKGYPPQVLESLDKAGSEVVDLLGDPRQTGEWRRRGLVIGDVQSGKTATYIGIVNKAADAGYKLVVLLTGGTESLRKQTQFRIDEGFLGRDSSIAAHDRLLGVGNHPTTTKFLRGQGMTTYAKDFVGASLESQAIFIDPNADHPYVFVIKKNKTPLTNLITWLSKQFNDEQFHVPMLVVDDESDYASVNTNYKPSGDTSPTLINKKIRELLDLTTQSSYMAFTATPFANVFIDHATYDEALKDDLFPHHYIYALSAPSNYMGAHAFFGTSSDAEASHLNDITDADQIFPPKHKSTLQVSDLPPSLEEAIRAFIVGSAIRLVRGDSAPRSMLINVSRFKHVQSQVYELVANRFSVMKRAIEIHAQPPVTGDDEHGVLRSLAKTFAAHYEDSGTSWTETREKLLRAVIDTSVELINSSRDKKSDDKPRNMIAVGGDVLSRGLTLEGLTISYFFRMVGAADTLLQMARWFGYRPGYGDLVRVWITSDVADQFRFVNDVSEELREQIRVMRQLDRTPEDFGLQVRKHPQSLAITAKKGASESRSLVVSLAGRRIESTRIPATRTVIRGNYTAVKSFLKAIDADDPSAGWTVEGSKYLGKHGVDRSRIADLLSEFRYDRGNLILANSLDRIIRDQAAPAFQKWTVGLVNGDGGPMEIIPGLQLPSAPQRMVRYSPDSSSGSFRVSGRSARLAGTTDLANTFPHDGPPLIEPHVYSFLPHPTLLLYPLQPKLEVSPSQGGEDRIRQALSESERATAAWESVSGDDAPCLMALKIAIPGPPGGSGGDVEYLLNGPAIEQYAQDFAISAEDEEDLDE